MKREASKLLCSHEGFERHSHIFVLRSKGKNGEPGSRENSVRNFTRDRTPPPSPAIAGFGGQCPPEKRGSGIHLSPDEILVKSVVVMNYSVYILKCAIKYFTAAFVGALLSYFFFPGLMRYIDKKILGTAEIVVNITELSSLENTHQLEDFSMMLATRMGYGWLAAVRVGQPELNRIFGSTLIPDDFGQSGQTIIYSVTITNKGNRTAHDFLLSLSGDNLKIDNKRDKSLNVDFVNCGGFGKIFSCDINIKDIGPNENAVVFIRANSLSVHNISCNIEGIGNCKVNRRNFYLKRVDSTQNVSIQLNNKRIKLPPLNDGKQIISYKYDLQKNKWLPLNKKSLQLILKERNLLFDISSIPNNATIIDYEIYP